MKIVHSKLARVESIVPVRQGFRARFVDHRATLPNDVADFLVQTNPAFYSIVADNLAEVLEGARVLVVRDTGLGDVLMTTPLIRALATRYQAKVDVLTHERYRCLFDGNPHVRRTLALEKDAGRRREEWDIVLDLRLIVENEEASGRHKHRAYAFAEFGDVLLTEEERHCDLFLSDEEREAGRALLDNVVTGFRAMIGYVWRSSTGNRNWFVAQHRAVISALLSEGYAVVLLDHESQEEALQQVGQHPGLLDLSGRLNVRQTATVIAACDAVITPDTGLFHVAGALDVPTLAYFGALPAAERQAHSHLTVFQNTGRCALGPCRSYMCLNREPGGQPRCLSVEPAQVLAELTALIPRGTQSVRSGAEVTEVIPDVIDAGVAGSSADNDPATGDARRTAGDSGRRGRQQRRRSHPEDTRVTAAA